MSAEILFFFSVRVAILADSLVIALLVFDAAAFFTGPLSAGFTPALGGAALGAFAAGFAALGAAFFAVAIFISFIVFQTTKLFWPRRYSYGANAVAIVVLPLLALDGADCVKLAEQISVFQLTGWPMLATKNAGLH
jgi:hypothetical protein